MLIGNDDREPIRQRSGDESVPPHEDRDTRSQRSVTVRAVPPRPCRRIGRQVERLVVGAGDLDKQGVDGPDFNPAVGGPRYLRERGAGGMGVRQYQNPAGRKTPGRPRGIMRALVGLPTSGRRLDSDERRIRIKQGGNFFIRHEECQESRPAPMQRERR